MRYKDTISHAPLPLFEKRHSRRTDPPTSRAAAEHAERNLGERCRQALKLVRLHRGYTAAELDAINCTPEGAVRKRLSDLAAMGLVHTNGFRQCHITGRNCQVWYPTERE